MFCDQCTLVCLDDKNSIKVGERGNPVAAVDCGKAVLVNKDVSLSVADHDFTKLKLTPSVTLVCDVPATISETFYHGQVFVTV